VFFKDYGDIFHIIHHRIFSCRVCLVLLLGIIFLFNSLDSYAQDNDKYTELLLKISKAYRELTYRATNVNEQIVNGEVKGRVIDKTIVLEPEKRWVQRIFNNAYNYDYSNKDYIHIGNLYYERIIGTDSIRANIREPLKGILSNSDDIVLLKKNYYIKFIREEKYLNRLVDVVKLISRNGDRPFIKICVDRENGFIYRLVKYDNDRNKIYQRYVEEVEFNPTVDESLFEVNYNGPTPVPRHREIYESISDLMQDINVPILLPKHLPPGFVLDKIVMTPRNKSRSIQFYYKDGLTSLSFFQEPSDVKEEKVKLVRRSFTGNILVQEIKDNIMRNFVGDFPLGTIFEFFNNLELIKKEEDLIKMKQAASSIKPIKY